MGGEIGTFQIPSEVSEEDAWEKVMEFQDFEPVEAEQRKQQAEFTSFDNQEKELVNKDEVDGSREALQLAKQQRIKRLGHISILAAAARTIETKDYQSNPIRN